MMIRRDYNENDDEDEKGYSGETLLLENDIDQSQESAYENDQIVSVPSPSAGPIRFNFRKLWSFMGPGMIMSIAYIDPGNLESDVRAGGIAGYNFLWILLLSTIAGYVLQLLAARLGVVTGKHLAEICREKYPKVPRLFLWILMELAIIGADIQEIVGSAIAISLLSYGKIPLYAGAIITAVDTFIILFLEKFGVRKLEAVFAVLIATMAGCFGWLYVASSPKQLDVLERTFVPHMTSYCHGRGDSQYAITALGIFGAVVMPHNIYLHSALVLSRNIDRDKANAVKEGILYNSIDSALALILAFAINLFALCTFAGKPFTSSVTCAKGNLSLSTSGCYLRYNFSESCYSPSGSTTAGGLCRNFSECPSSNENYLAIVWAVGLLAAGQAATMTGTYAGQFIMDGFLDIKWPRWKRVILTRSIAIVPVLAISIPVSLDKEKDSNFKRWDSMINIEQSLLLPFALLPVLHMTNSRRVMGNFRISKLWLAVAWFLAVVSMGVNFGGIIYGAVSAKETKWTIMAGFLLPIYGLIVCYFLFGPGTVQRFKEWVRLARWKKKMWQTPSPVATSTTDSN
eukprot:m.208486 g.208486  ORF g.208486 m.208486 type:complete len:571 (+) comp39709_c0_seq31:227-1939(+)